MPLLYWEFDSRMTFEKHLRSVSRTALKRLGILQKSHRVIHDESLLVRLSGFFPARFAVLLCSAMLGCGYTP